MIEASPMDPDRSGLRGRPSWWTGFLLLLLLSILSGCRTLYLPSEMIGRPSEADAAPIWTPLDEGLDFYTFHDKSIPLALFALRLDLNSDLWELVITAPGSRAGADSSGDLESGYALGGMKTSDFLAAEGCRAAVNGGPFSPYRWFFSGSGQMPAGLYVWQGELYGAPLDRFDALVVDADGAVSIRSQAEYPFPGEYILGGFTRLLRTGSTSVGNFSAGPSDSRTALGLSGDGRYLYLMVADGRRSFYSRGLTLEETALFLRSLGASEGINLDGGGSSTMVIGESREKGSLSRIIPRIVNRPVNYRGFPERIVASHIGIRKKQLNPTL